MIEKGFYFGYGQKGYGYGEDRLLSQKLEVDFKKYECNAIAFIKSKHFEGKASHIVIEATNTGKKNIIATIEKKYSNRPMVTQTEILVYDTSKRIHVNISEEEKDDIKEVVIAIHQDLNPKIKKAAISIEASQQC